MKRSPLPLKRFRIVTLATNVPVPVAAGRLAELGAKVTKIEPPDGDALGTQHCPSWYQQMIRGQKVLRLNLKASKDRKRLDDFLKKSDLLLTSSRPASLDRLSLGWKELHRKFPKLSQVALVGHPFPRRGVAGHDLTYQAQLGLLSPPAMPATLMADIAASERVFTAGLLLLVNKSKQGQYVEISIEEAVKAFAAPLWYGLTASGGPLGGRLPQYNLYRASNGWVAVAALEPAFLRRLPIELGLARLTYEDLATKFLTRTAEEWEKWALDRDLPIAMVRSNVTPRN